MPNDNFSKPFVFIQLNFWDGRLFYPISKFLKREQPDILSVQEILSGPVDISPSYMSAEALIRDGYFNTVIPGGKKPRLEVKNQPFDVQCATFIRDTAVRCDFSRQIPLPTNSNFAEADGSDAYFSLLHSKILLADGAFVHVLNHHGRLVFDGRMGSDITDHDFRKIAEYAAGLDGPIILSGDFNLHKEARPLVYLKKAGLKNLNDVHGITSGRNEFSWRPDECVSHIFINDAVIADHYAIPQDNVSDHLPLLLKCRVLKQIS